MRHIAVFCFVTVAPYLYAAEGMWPPWLLPDAIYREMQVQGLRLSPEEIYSANQPSLKDAVLLFGGGCTGSVISSEGLILTNHHCGRGNIQALSTLENDYLTHGFWAKQRSEELPCTGLTATFVVQVEDVTESVLAALRPATDEPTRARLLDSITRRLTHARSQGTHYKAILRPFYHGNQFVLFLLEEFRDVRLVGAPPQSIGNFGGDEDNWMWPRHTGDFALFRIYAAADNTPADYHPDNRPFKPRRVLPISLKGVEEGDFTMVYGFPGRTQQYISSYGLALIQQVSNPLRIDLRGQRLQIWWQHMLENDTVRLKYAAKYYGLSNAWKKWQGEQVGLRIMQVADHKQRYENLIRQRINERSSDGGVFGTENLLDQLQVAYDSLQTYQRWLDYWNEALMAPEIWRLTHLLRPLVDSTLIHGTYSVALLQQVKKQVRSWYANYHKPADQQVADLLLRHYVAFAGPDRTPPQLYAHWRNASKRELALGAYLFTQSLLDDEAEVEKLWQRWNKRTARTIADDPIYRLAQSLAPYYETHLQPHWNRWNDRITALNRRYMQLQQALFAERVFYPDANLTLRVSYGRVSGYAPRNAVWYDYYTTARGIIEKHKPGDPSFDVPQTLLELIRTATFGPYADAQGELRTCFIASNHTSGGNSGSPVLNAWGQLVGVNFDRCWEGTMSDLYYHESRCRNISVDIRYILFLIDVYAGAGYLLQEMQLVN